MAYRTITFIAETNPFVFVISFCAGIIFALIANTYLIHNPVIKNESNKNSLYASLSLLTAFTPVKSSRIYIEFLRKVQNIESIESFNYRNSGFLNGLGLGFTVTNFALQLLDGNTKIKFRSPFYFEKEEVKT